MAGEAHCRICGFDGAAGSLPPPSVPPPGYGALPAPRGPRRSKVATAARWVVGSVVVLFVGLVVVGLATDQPTEAQLETTPTTVAPESSEGLWGGAHRFCAAEGAEPIADAPPHVPGGAVDRVSVMVEREDMDGKYAPRYDLSRSEFSVSQNEPFSLVACMKVGQPATPVETCTGYEQGATAELMKGSFDLTLYEAASGRVIATKPGWTEDPHCPYQITVGDSFTTTIWPSFDEKMLTLFLYPYAME